MAFTIFVCLLGLVGLLFIISPAEEEPVARARLPKAGSRLSAPEPTPQAATRNLRSELERVAERYPASYGVIVADPSSGKTIEMNSDQPFLAASLTKLPVLLTLYRPPPAARGTSTARSPCLPPTSRLTAPASCTAVPSAPP
jgi:D-alanyl-D-alanine carboxypeptidase